jgi:hypothetical protein
MRALVGRLNHRDAVLKHLDALLVLYPAGRQFAADFPELKAAIRAHFADGTPPPLAALDVAERMIGTFVGQLEAGERTKVHDALSAEGPAAFGALAARRVSGSAEAARERVRFVTELAGAALFIAARMAEEGMLRRSEYLAFLAAIEASLGAPAGALAARFAPGAR